MTSGKLPQVSSKELVKALRKLGYGIKRRKSSHMHLRSLDYPPITVPDHDPISRGTLRAIIRQIGISRESFIELIGGE
jgi:predicted RNA binding protein YcfA (HicA-like mRNA interferase family)